MYKNRRIYSIKDELLKKSQESALAAIQIFNNPLITFKSETFIVLMNIAWTYLLHSYYREKGIEYRYYKKTGKRKKFNKTKNGANKYWELEACLQAESCPLEEPIKNNLKFLIEIRHEIEHQMTTKIDNLISAKLQACCINYNSTIKKLFGTKFGLDKITPIALQLFTFSEKQIDQIKNIPDLPKNIINFISDFELNLKEERNDERYSYRIIYIRDNVNREGQADEAIRFVDENSSQGKEIHNVLIKNSNPIKLTETQVVNEMQQKGFPKFKKYDHQIFWKSIWRDAAARNTEGKDFGELVINNQWMWYKEKWLKKVIDHCEKNIDKFTD